MNEDSTYAKQTSSRHANSRTVVHKIIVAAMKYFPRNRLWLNPAPPLFEAVYNKKKDGESFCLIRARTH